MIKRMSMQGVVSWLGIASIVFFFSSITFLGGWRLTKVVQGSLEERSFALANAFSAELVEPALIEDGYSIFRSLKKMVDTNEDVLFAYVKLNDGSVLAHTFTGGFPQALLDLRDDNPQRFVMFTTESDRVLEVVAPMLEGQLGYLHLGVSQEQVHAEQKRFILMMAFILGVTLAATFLVARQIGGLIGGPIDQLAATARRIPNGDVEAGDIPLEGSQEVNALALALRDMVGDLRRLEEENRVAQQNIISTERLAALGELAAGLAHEILNPLDGVLEGCRYASKNIESPERVGRYLGLMEQGLERIERVMRQMLEFARGPATRLDIQKNDVIRMIEGNFELAVPQLEKRGITITMDTTGLVSPFARCDRHLIGQALLNLMLNAADACEASEKPLIVVSTKRKNDWMMLSVDDNGIGISTENVEKVFAPFFTTKDPGKGTGMGLAISQQVARQCGCDLFYDPENARLGGARFTLQLPVCKE